MIHEWGHGLHEVVWALVAFVVGVTQDAIKIEAKN
jgi:hypothetical protein